MTTSRLILAQMLTTALLLSSGCDSSDKKAPDAGTTAPKSTSAPSAARAKPTTRPAVRQVPPGLLIKPGVGAGALQFGMTADERDQILGKPERMTGSACEYPSKGIAVLSSPHTDVGAILFGDSGTPNSPLVKACKYRTAEGIGMGSTRNQIIAAYGQPTKSETEAKIIETLVYDKLGAEFTLRSGKVAHMVFRQIRR
jgi:hypothetical protein